MKRTPLNKVSKKRQATNAKRREFVREQIAREDEMGPRESTCAVPRFAAIMFNRGAVVWGAGSTRMSARRDFWVWWEHEVEPDDIVPLSAAARMHMRLGGDIHKLRLSFDGKRLVTREET